MSLKTLFFLLPLLVSVGRSAVVLQLGTNVTAATFLVDSSALPPDAGLGVSSNHIVELINGRYSVFNKNMTKLQTMTDSNFWFKAGVTLPSGWFFTDPRIVFDTMSQRWFATMIDADDSGSPNRFAVAVSATSDPTGTWRGAAFLADPSSQYTADFPTMGIDAQGVYLAGDMFDSFGFVGSMLVSIPKTDLLANPPTVSGRRSFGPLDYSTYGSILQPTIALGAGSASETVLAMGDLGYDLNPHSTLVGFSIQNVSSGASLGAPATISIPAYSIPQNARESGATTNNIDDGDTRFSSVVYRTGDALYAIHSTEVNNRAAIQWFKINAPDLNVIDTGIITDPVLDLFYPSIAANSNGLIMIAFNGCSSTNFISSYALAGEPINGKINFGNRVQLKAGVASYRRTATADNPSRWGDYSALCVDPSNPNRFWALTEYPSSTTAWSTELSELIGAPLSLTIGKAGANVLVSWPGPAAGYQLQSTTNLASLTWTPVPQTPVLKTNQFTVSIPRTNLARLFRLMK